jgi:hypothetical protein
MLSALLRMALVPLFVTASTLPALSGEKLFPIAQSGDWITMEHRINTAARPDVCIAVNADDGVIFRIDDNRIEIRILDVSWALPPNTNGSVGISVGDWKGVFDIFDNTPEMVIAEIKADDIVPMFAAMDNSSSMIIAVGEVPAFPVSLAGSTKATNAFRTCAGRQDHSMTPGSDPFRYPRAHPG